MLCLLRLGAAAVLFPHVIGIYFIFDLFLAVKHMNTILRNEEADGSVDICMYVVN